MTHQSNQQSDEPNKTPTNDIGYPQYERTLENFYMWTSGGSLKDKLREFAIRYETGRADNESEIFLNEMHDAIIGFILKDRATAVETARVNELGRAKPHLLKQAGDYSEYYETRMAELQRQKKGDGDAQV